MEILELPSKRKRDDYELSYVTLHGFYNVCHHELNHQMQPPSLRDILAILQSVSIIKWPMLEIFESVDIFKTVEELHVSYGMDAIVTIRAERNIMKTRDLQPYLIHIGPPNFLMPQWALLRSSLNTSVATTEYMNLITSVARIFRPRIELEGIAKEMVSMEFYMARMLILRDDFSQYEKNVYKLSSLARDNGTVRWHDIIRNLYVRAYGSDTGYDRWLVYVWDLPYLIYIYRLLQDDYNARAVVNYVGWNVVKDLGALTFRNLFEDFEKRVFGYQQSRKESDICAQLMVRLLPVQSDLLAYDPLADKPATTFVQRMVEQMKSTLLLQAAEIPWMDTETRIRAQAKEFEIQSSCVQTLKAIFMNKAARQMDKLNASHANPSADVRTTSPFTPDIIYMETSNTLVVPGLLVHNASDIAVLPPVHGFSTIGAMIAVKMIEVILFHGSYINERYYYEDWYSEWSRENYNGLLGCFIDNMNLFAPYRELVQVDFLRILKDVVLMAGAATLSYKAYLTFMGKYEEEFVRSNIMGLKITLNQYFFLHFSLNFCESTTSAYYNNFNLPEISTQLRLSLPLRHNFRMGSDFGCTVAAQMNAPVKCLVI